MEGKKEIFKKLMIYAAYATITVIAANCINIKIEHKLPERVYIKHDGRLNFDVQANHNFPHTIYLNQNHHSY